MTTQQPAFQQSKALDQQIQDMRNIQADAALGFLDNSVAYTAAHVFVLADMGKVVSISNASGVAATFPQDSDAPSIVVGMQCDVIQSGAGIVTITAGSGVTLRKAAATAKILAQYGRVTVRKIAANTWQVNGELAAS